MTLAICIRCGGEKIGAFTACARCGFVPETPEDKARSLGLSDHNLTAEELRAVAERIEAGDPPSFDEASVRQLAEGIAQLPPMKTPLGCLLAVWLPVAVMLILLVAVIVVFAYVWSNQP